jgi:hypothetical protein
MKTFSRIWVGLRVRSIPLIELIMTGIMSLGIAGGLQHHNKLLIDEVKQRWKRYSKGDRWNDWLG